MEGGWLLAIWRSKWTSEGVIYWKNKDWGDECDGQSGAPINLCTVHRVFIMYGRPPLLMWQLSLERVTRSGLIGFGISMGFYNDLKK